MPCRQLAGVIGRVAAGFLIGYAPVLLYSMLVEPARSPARVANLRQLLTAAPDIFGNIVPILAGFKIADDRTARGAGRGRYARRGRARRLLVVFAPVPRTTNSSRCS